MNKSFISCDMLRSTAQIKVSHHQQRINWLLLSDATYSITAGNNNDKQTALNRVLQKIPYKYIITFTLTWVSFPTKWILPSLLLLFQLMTPPGWGQFWPQGYHMNRIDIGPNIIVQGQMIKALLLVSEKKNFKFSFFVPMLQTCDPRAGPNLTPGASYEQPW